LKKSNKYYSKYKIYTKVIQLNKRDRIETIQKRIKALEELIATFKKPRHIGKNLSEQALLKRIDEVIPRYEAQLKRQKTLLSRLTKPKKRKEAKKKKTTRRR